MSDAVTHASSNPNRTAIYGTWTLRVILAAVFLGGSSMKLSGQPMMVANFDTVGIGQWFRYFTAILELTAAITVLIPRISILGALLMLVIDFGALIAQVFILHIDWIHVVILMALICLLIYLQRATLVFRRS